jgi:hypothetical protein
MALLLAQIAPMVPKSPDMFDTVLRITNSWIHHYLILKPGPQNEKFVVSTAAGGANKVCGQVTHKL